MESHEISSLPGCYLLVILGEPMCDNHKGKILQRVAKGLLSWNIETTQCDLKHLEQVCDNLIASKRNLLETALLLQHSTDKLAVEVLFNPQISALQQCLRNLLLSPTGHKHIIYAGYSFTGSGSWMLQDGVFRFQDFVDELSDPHITKVLSQYPAGCTLNMHLHCSPIGDWVTNNLENQSFSHLINLSLNPPDSPNGVPGASSLLEFIENSLTTLEKDETLESSPLIGNIRFERPTMYIFPSGQGDCSLFGITGFTMLIDGGFTRYPCFWKFVRHIERLDSIMMTRINESNLWGILHLLKGKQESSMFLKIGYVFCNIADKTDSQAKTGKEEITGYAGIQADANDLVISIIDYGNEIAARLKQIGCSPRQCLRESTPSPLTLYHKVGHGTLEMYVLSPPRDSRLLKDFLSYCNSDRESLPILRTRSAHKNGGKSGQDIAIPISDVMSICCLIVWRPADPSDRITRILFPGSAPQSQIMEGLNSLKDCNLFSSRVCTGLTVKQQSKQKQTVKSTSFKINEKFGSSSTRYRSVSPTLRKSRVTYAKQTSTDLGDKGGDSSESQSSPIKRKSNILLTQKAENSREKTTEESSKKTIEGDKKTDKGRTERKTKPRTSSTSRTSVISKTIAKSSEVSSESTNDKSRAVTRKVRPQVNTKQSPPKAKEKITKQTKETAKDNNKQGLIIDYDATDSKVQEARETYSEDDHRDSGKGSEDASPRKIPFLDHIRDEVEPDSLESHDIYGNSEICRDSLEHSEDEVITGDSRSTSQLEQTMSREDDEEMKSRSSPVQQDSELQSAMFSSLSSNMTVISGERIDDSDAEVASLTSKIDNNQAYQSTEMSRTEKNRRRSNDPSNSHRSLQSELQEIMKQSDEESIESKSSIENRRQSSQINQVDETRNVDSNLVSKESKRYSISGDEDLSTDSQKDIIINQFEGENKVTEYHESQSDEKIEDDKSDTIPGTHENETSNDKIETSMTTIEPNVDSNNECFEIDAKIIENTSDKIESKSQKDSIDSKEGESFIDESIQSEIPANKKEQITDLITEKKVSKIGDETKQTESEIITTFDSAKDEIQLTIGTNEDQKLSFEQEEAELIDQNGQLMSTSKSEKSQLTKEENATDQSATEKNADRKDSLIKEVNNFESAAIYGTEGSTKEDAETQENISRKDSRKESMVSIAADVTASVKPSTIDDVKVTLERKDSIEVSTESAEEATSRRNSERKESIAKALDSGSIMEESEKTIVKSSEENFVGSRKESIASSDGTTPKVIETIDRKDSIVVEKIESSTEEKTSTRKDSVSSQSAEVMSSDIHSRKESIASSDGTTSKAIVETIENIARKDSVVDKIESIASNEEKMSTRKDSVSSQAKEVISSNIDSRKESIASIPDNIVEPSELIPSDVEKTIQERKGSIKVSSESTKEAMSRRDSERKDSIVKQLEEDSKGTVRKSSKEDSVDSRRQSTASISDNLSKSFEQDTSEDGKKIGKRKESIESTIIKETTSERDSRKESISYKDTEIVDSLSTITNSEELSSRGDKNTIERKDSHTEVKMGTHKTLTSESSLIVETSNVLDDQSQSVDSSIEKTVVDSTRKDSLQMSHDSSKIEASIGQDAQKTLEATTESNEIINRSSIEVESIKNTITDTKSTGSPSTTDSSSKGNETDLDINESKIQSSEVISTTSVSSTQEIKLDRKTSIVSLNSEENQIHVPSIDVNVNANAPPKVELKDDFVTDELLESQTHVSTKESQYQDFRDDKVSEEVNKIHNQLIRENIRIDESNTQTQSLKENETFHENSNSESNKKDQDNSSDTYLNFSPTKCSDSQSLQEDFESKIETSESSKLLNEKIIDKTNESMPENSQSKSGDDTQLSLSAPHLKGELIATKKELLTESSENVTEYDVKIDSNNNTTSSFTNEKVETTTSNLEIPDDSPTKEDIKSPYALESEKPQEFSTEKESKSDNTVRNSESLSLNIGIMMSNERQVLIENNEKLAFDSDKRSEDDRKQSISEEKSNVDHDSISGPIEISALENNQIEDPKSPKDPLLVEHFESEMSSSAKSDKHESVKEIKSSKSKPLDEPIQEAATNLITSNSVSLLKVDTDKDGSGKNQNDGSENQSAEQMTTKEVKSELETSSCSSVITKPNEENTSFEALESNQQESSTDFDDSKHEKISFETLQSSESKMEPSTKSNTSKSFEIDQSNGNQKKHQTVQESAGTLKTSVESTPVTDCNLTTNILEKDSLISNEEKTENTQNEYEINSAAKGSSEKSESSIKEETEVCKRKDKEESIDFETVKTISKEDSRKASVTSIHQQSDGSAIGEDVETIGNVSRKDSAVLDKVESISGTEVKTTIRKDSVDTQANDVISSKSDSRKESIVSLSGDVTASVKPSTIDDVKVTLERKDSIKVSTESTEEAASRRNSERKESIAKALDSGSMIEESEETIVKSSEENFVGSRKESIAHRMEQHLKCETIDRKDSVVVEKIESITSTEEKMSMRKDSVSSQSAEVISSNIHSRKESIASSDGTTSKTIVEKIENISRKDSVVDKIESSTEEKTSMKKDSVSSQAKEVISSNIDSRKESIASIPDNIVKSPEPAQSDAEKTIQERKGSIKVLHESTKEATSQQNSERKDSIVKKLEEDKKEAVLKSSGEDSVDSRRQSTASISDNLSKSGEPDSRDSRRESISYKDTEVVDSLSTITDSEELSIKGDKNTIERKDSHTEVKIDSTRKDSLQMSHDSSKIEASIGQDAQKTLEATTELNEIINRSSIEVESIKNTITDTKSTVSSSTTDSSSKGNEADSDNKEAKIQSSEVISTTSVSSTQEIKLDRKTSIVSLNSEENQIHVPSKDETWKSSESGHCISDELMNIPYADSSSIIRTELNKIWTENDSPIGDKSTESAISNYAVEKISKNKSNDEDLGNNSRGFGHLNKSESTSSEVNTNSDSKFGVFTSVDEETHFYLEDSDSLTQDGHMMTSLPEKSGSDEDNRISSSIVENATLESMQLEIDSNKKLEDFDPSVSLIGSKTHKDSEVIEKVIIGSGFVEETKIQMVETSDSYSSSSDNQLEARKSSLNRDSELDKIEATSSKRSSVDHPTEYKLQEYTTKSSATSSQIQPKTQYDSIERKNITKQESKTSEKVSESNSSDSQIVDREFKADTEAAISRPKSDNSLESNKEFPASECLKEETEIYNGESVKSAVITFEDSQKIVTEHVTTVDKNSSKSENESLTNYDLNNEISRSTSETHSSSNVTSSHKFPSLPGQTLDKSSCDIVDKGVSIRSGTSDGENGNLAKASTNTELFSAIHRENKLTNIILPEVIKEETIDKIEETEKMSFSPVKVTSDEFISKVEASPGTSFSTTQFVTSADMPSVHLRRSAQMAGQVLYEIPDEEDTSDLSQCKIDQDSKSHQVKGSDVHPEASHSQEVDDHKTITRKRVLDSENTSMDITSPQDSKSGLCCFPRSVEVDGLKKEREDKTEKSKSPERLETIVTFQTENLSEQQIKEKESTLKEWGNPLGLPKPTDPTDSKGNRSTSKSRAKSSDRTDAQRNTSTRRSESTNDPIKPIHLDLAYIPHHGDRNYCNADYFKKIRARYYVLSGVNPSKEVLNALIEGKQTWEDVNAEVTLIPSHESEVLCLWMASNQKTLETLHIEVAPSASRCSVILQDQESSCSAYRVEF
ncbi:LOW QUALITY PROTEIN: microtubule-associated protein futsch-like [Panonychus citri]|uniref:LOW QUALITY PROTEIN: microtubule-associated protein futsch-like n=1 Tax=Panonychus citri TaxID=50023 RepID=UPI0023076143|nr:LOW QUALITY PROTEIN: microtubule-associated protein futsch-like [Panonychus citri]